MSTKGSVIENGHVPTPCRQGMPIVQCLQKTQCWTGGLDLHPLPEVATDRSHPATVAARVMLRINEITSLTSLTLSERHPTAQKVAGNRNTRLPSSALSVPSDSQEHTTYALISEHTRMSDRSFARSAAKRSLVNKIANDTKVCILRTRHDQ